MKSVMDRKKPPSDTSQSLLRIIAVLFVLISVTVFVFMRSYDSYTDGILYAERLGQMQEVTEQLFKGLDDLIENQWYIADVQANRLIADKPATQSELLNFLQDQAELSRFDELSSDLVVVDSRGRYYTQSGMHGLLDEMDYLMDEPERVSFVSSAVTKERTQMFFLVHLERPMMISDGKRMLELNYCGIARDMMELNQYFGCKAYNGRNAVYVLSEDGTKLFTGENSVEFLEGFNAYTILRNVGYLHNSSFDSALETLKQTGLSYSNAAINSEEYYYSLYQMNNAAWILLFMVPSDSVAVNTVNLVNSTTTIVMCFAVLMIIVCGGCIYYLLRRQQQQALRVAEENNAILEANNNMLKEAQEITKKALETAEEASQAKSEFLANMSHDIRTPMNAIVGITKLMAHDKDDPEKMDTYVQKVQLSSQHLLSLINDVLDMSKIESSSVKLNTESINLAEQVNQVESIIRPQTEERNQRFSIHVHEIRHEYLTGDAVRLRQILINLLSNAVKYTQMGGNIRLDMSELPSTDTERAVIRITVADNGYGMTPEFVARIFEPFTRAENSMTNKVQGTGLGMAITKNIVDLMGGTISVKSVLNKGSCFEVIIPLNIDKTESVSLPCRKLLVITDEEDFITNARAAFSATDVDVHFASSEAEADKILDESAMDVVLLGGKLHGQRLADNINRLRDKTKDALLFYCCDYDGQKQLDALAENGGVNAVLYRPLFLTNLANAIERARSNVPTSKADDISVLNGMRFLCAEDNALNAEILDALMDMNGAKCVIYPNGAEIVKAFLTVKPGDYDAIMMDVQMPVMNGLDATRAIRTSANPLGKTIPIIAMTANAFSEDVQSCLNAGMDAHVSKPLDIAVLERTIRSIITPPPGIITARQRRQRWH